MTSSFSIHNLRISAPSPESIRQFRTVFSRAEMYVRTYYANTLLKNPS